MVKRSLDVALSFLGLLASSPLLVPVILAVWLQDFHSPFFIARRVGLRGQPFRMVKLRSMVIDAEKSGVDSTSSDDSRITAVGRFIRAYKLDEISQLWNVLKGDMSLVGPRPQVQRDVDVYTDVEKGLLAAKPGITDISSIVFADEGDILSGYADPDLAYHQLIRPWKSRFGLLYIERQSLALDLALVCLTVLSILSRPRGLKALQRLMKKLDVEEGWLSVVSREQPLSPCPPPGAEQVVMDRSTVAL